MVIRHTWELGVLKAHLFQFLIKLRLTAEEERDQGGLLHLVAASFDLFSYGLEPAPGLACFSK